MIQLRLSIITELTKLLVACQQNVNKVQIPSFQKTAWEFISLCMVLLVITVS